MFRSVSQFWARVFSAASGSLPFKRTTAVWIDLPLGLEAAWRAPLLAVLEPR